MIIIKKEPKEQNIEVSEASMLLSLIMMGVFGSIVGSALTIYYLVF